MTKKKKKGFKGLKEHKKYYYRLDKRTLWRRMISLEDRSLLAIQMERDWKTPYTVVPGYIVDSHGLYLEIKPVDDKEKNTIEGIVKKYGFKGPISYW